MYSLRDYQSLARVQTYDLIRESHRRIINWLMTGGGKGLLMSQYAADATSKGKRTLTVMRRRELIFQTKRNYEKYHSHVVSIIMAGTKQKDFLQFHFNQVCSIDSLRGKLEKNDWAWLKDFDIILVDECHDTNSPTYQKLFEFLGDKIFIGFTATPFTVGGKALKFWDAVVKPIEAHEMRDKGYLVPDLTYVPEDQIDTRGLDLKAGDFSEKDLFERANESVIVGNIVKNWIDNGQGRPTLLFAVNKEHSALMAAAFNLNGVAAIHIDESTTTKERADALAKLNRGEVKVLCSINTLTTGVDQPSVSCLILARPTHSEVLFCQAVGRGLRPYKVCSDCGFEYGAEQACLRCKSPFTSFNKPDCLIFDHAGNTLRHGLPYAMRTAKLHNGAQPSKSKNNETKDVLIKTCEQCRLVFDPRLPACPACGVKKAVASQVIKEKDGTLKLVDEDTMSKIQLSKCVARLSELEMRERWYGWKPNAKYFKLHKELGDVIFKFEKELKLPGWLKKMIWQQSQEQAK